MLLSVEALLLLLTAPWKIRVQGYFSLERSCLLVKVSLGRLRLVSVKASIEKERVRISVNGKKPVYFYGRTGGNVPEEAEIIEAAKNMAAFSVAFVSDASREEALQALSPCALIHEFRELIDIVKEEREWSDTTIW